jgi:hypothetical protein
MKEGARREAGLVVREAELQAQKIVEAARAEEAVIQGQLAALRRTRRQVGEALRSTLEMYRRLVEQEIVDDGADADEPA